VKVIRKVENYPANYTASYPILTTLRIFKLTRQQRDTVQSNEERKKRRKTEKQTRRGKLNVHARKKHHIIKTGPCNFKSTGP
jgi:hypothetical protein